MIDQSDTAVLDWLRGNAAIWDKGTAIGLMPSSHFRFDCHRYLLNHTIRCISSLISSWLRFRPFCLHLLVPFITDPSGTCWTHFLRANLPYILNLKRLQLKRRLFLILMQVTILVFIQCMLKKLFVAEKVATWRFVAVDILTCDGFFVWCGLLHQFYRIVDQKWIEKLLVFFDFSGATNDGFLLLSISILILNFSLLLVYVDFLSTIYNILLLRPASQLYVVNNDQAVASTHIERTYRGSLLLVSWAQGAWSII